MTVPSEETSPTLGTDASPMQIPPPYAGIAGRLIRLCLKELREILRDRRTIITLVLMPLLVYPILSLIFNKLLLTTTTDVEAGQRIEARLGFQNEEDGELFQQLLANGSRLLTEQGQSTNDIDNLDVRYGIYENELEQSLAAGDIDIAVQRFRSSEPSNAVTQWTLKRRANSPLGEQLVDIFRRRLMMVNQALATRLLDNARLPRTTYSSMDVQLIRQGDGQVVSLTSFIPLMLILMTITGAVYPAIDLTAGERERGTMEALIAAPIPRLGLLLAKYVAVVFVALLTAVANLTAMTVTLYATGLQQAVFGDAGLSIATLVQVFGLLILFSAFFSSVLLAITSFARSFKEAQAYLIPLMLLSLGPGIISLSPDIELTQMWAVTPLINIVLLARDIFANDFDPTMGLVVIVATTLYAIVALSVAARVFGTDALLYGSQKGWRDLVTRPPEARPAASISAALFCFAILFISVFYALGALAQVKEMAMPARVASYAAVSMVIFVVVPLGFAWQSRVDLRSGFGLTPGTLWTWLAAIPWALSLWTVSHELVLFAETIGLVSLAEKSAQVQSLLDAWKSLNIGLIIFAFGITPAVVEEFFFRGFLFRALRAKLPASATIVLSAMAFGAFHVIGAKLLTPERFLPSTFLGLALGWLAYRSGSILPGMLLHAIHNSIMLLVSYYKEDLANWGIGTEDAAHLPISWHIAAWVAMAVGLGLTLLPPLRSPRQANTLPTPALPQSGSDTE